MNISDEVRAFLSKIGTQGGSEKSKAKTAAARLNAKMGGRPTLEDVGKKLTYTAQKKRESRARLAKKNL